MILSLTDIERKYLRLLESSDRSSATVANYRRLFLNLHQFGRDCQIAVTTESLTTDLVREFQHWLITTPLKHAYRGSTKRTPGGIFLQMELIKRLTGWLGEEGLLVHPVKVTLPKVPHRRRTALSLEHLDQLLESPYLVPTAGYRPTLCDPAWREGDALRSAGWMNLLDPTPMIISHGSLNPSGPSNCCNSRSKRTHSAADARRNGDETIRVSMSWNPARPNASPSPP